MSNGIEKGNFKQCQQNDKSLVEIQYGWCQTLILFEYQNYHELIETFYNSLI